LRKRGKIMKKFFRFDERKTNYKTEIAAGATTFMTMAYIIFVNPFILSAAGMDFGSVMTATIISAGITTILMGLITNYPFALASGMGLNAFFAYVVAAEFGWQATLGAVFIAGIAFFVLAVSGLTKHIDAVVPVSLKSAVAAGIGLFIAFIGLQNAGIIVANETTQVTLGDLGAPGPLLSLIGIAIIAVLMARKVKGAILIGILLTTVVSFAMGVQEMPTRLRDVFGPPASLAPILMEFDFRAALSIPFFVIFSFMFVDVFDTMGTLLGIGARAGFLDKDGRLPKINRAMLVDSIGTVGGAILGTSTVTTYIESTAGIAEGGRTGFSSVVTGVLFFMTLFLAPLAGLIPAEATAPALVIIGVLMVGAVMKIDFNDFTEALPAFLTMVLMPLAQSIADGIALGFIAFPFVKVVAGRSKEVHWLLYVLAAISLVHFFWPI